MNGCEHQRVYYQDYFVGRPLERRCQDCNELLPLEPTVTDLEHQLAEVRGRLDAIERVLDDDSGAASGVRHEVRASYMNSPHSTVDIVTCRSDCPRCALDRILHPKEAK